MKSILFKLALNKSVLFLILIQLGTLKAQSPWPSESWASAVNLTGVMDTNGITELSSLHWNPNLNRLYVVHGDGRLHVLQYNTGNNTFTD